MKSLFAFLFVFVATSTCFALEIDLADRGKFTFDLPEFWSITRNEPIKTNGAAVGYLLHLKAPTVQKGEARIQLMFTRPLKLDPEYVREAVVKGYTRYDAKTKQSEAHTIEPFALKRGYGAYAIIKNPRLSASSASVEGRYKFGLSGVVQPDERVSGIVMLVVDDTKGPEAKAMIAMVNSIAVQPKER